MYTQMEGESKYHVASILSSMATGANGNSYGMPSTAYTSGIMSAATSTTTSLTPTTLSNLEQTFIELQSVPSTTSMANHMTHSGFVPPIVNSMAMSDGDMYGSDSSSMSNEDYLPSAPKRIKIGDKTTTIMSKYEIENPQRKTHRRQIREEDITVEEKARRYMRRERNKVAAAKCRQRRVDHTNVLLNETEDLEKEGSSIEQEIQKLQQEKDQLEFILQAHNPICKINGHAQVIKIKTEPETYNDKPKCYSNKPLELTTKDLPSTGSRPSTLSLLKRDVKSDLPSLPSITSAGINLTTPSSGFYSFSLDTMVDHTGLTPLTGSNGHSGFTPITSITGLTPLTGSNGHSGFTPLTSMPVSCSSEVSKKQSTSSEEGSSGMKSPSSLITL